MGSSDSHDAFTESAGNAPKHDDAFTQPKKDAPAGDIFYSQSFKDGLAHHWSQICEIRFKAVTSLKDSSSFDDIDFYRYDGGYIKGSELRDCQTGCEMLEKMGYGNAGILSSIPGLKCACKQFDEQLQFINEEDEPLSNVDYCITRADGMEVKGTTDNEGKTKRIKNTQQEMAIEKVEFFASENTPFCPKTGIHDGMLLASIGLSDIKTTQENVGTSVRKVTVQGEYRKLTPGEIEMAKLVFKDSINYGKVKVYHKVLVPIVQNITKNIMTPWGDLYCTDDNFSEDFSAELNPDRKIWFMHEMTHVWQYQLGYNVAWEGIKSIIGYLDGSVYYYDYTKSTSNTLRDYNFEQQAEIISHYHAAECLIDKRYLNRLPFLKSVLKDFLRSPQDANLLPK
jgi:hypothetical protein